MSTTVPEQPPEPTDPNAPQNPDTTPDAGSEQETGK